MNEESALHDSPPAQAELRVPTVSVEELLGAEGACVVDLRSPAEFAQDHLPGARNVPLFGDLERAIVGTIHRRSPEDAFDEGRRIALERAASLVAEIAACANRKVVAGDYTRDVLALTAGGYRAMTEALRRERRPGIEPGTIVLYCWRGGMRSASVAALLLHLCVERVLVLEGGYKSYRRRILEELAAWQAPPAFVLRGFTGVGKTLVLRELERLWPSSTIDLEGLAGHRSSILGMVGLAPRSQRAFEGELAARLRRGSCGPVVLEGESRKVGDAVIPAAVWRALDGGADVLLEAPLERRIDVLVADYLALDGQRAELREKLPFLEQRLGPRRWGGELVRLLDSGRDRELAALLLERYYDPLYRSAERPHPPVLTLDSSDPARAAQALAAFVEAQRPRE